MKNWQRNRWRIDYQDCEPDRQMLSMYLQAENFRKKNRLQKFENSGQKGRIFLCCLAGVLFCIGLFFVFF